MTFQGYMVKVNHCPLHNFKVNKDGVGLIKMQVRGTRFVQPLDPFAFSLNYPWKWSMSHLCSDTFLHTSPIESSSLISRGGPTEEGCIIM